MFWCPIPVQVPCTMTQYCRCFPHSPQFPCFFTWRPAHSIQFIIYRRRRPLFDVSFDRWNLQRDTQFSVHCLSVDKDRVFCDSRRHVCSVGSHVVGWNAMSTGKDGCRRFERSVTLSSSWSSSPRRYFGDYSAYTASHPGRVECWTAPQRHTHVQQKLHCSVVTIIVVVVCSGLADGSHLTGVGLWHLPPFGLCWRMRNSVFRRPVLMLQQLHLDVVLATVPVFRPQREEVTGRSRNTRWGAS